MLYLLNKDVRTVRWNGEPLHEASSAIVKETMDGDFTLTVKYPISDSGIYQLIQEDMLIKAPTPVLGAQLFRIKKPVENNDHLEITAYHISDDVMQRSITPVSVTSQSCGMALSRMVQNTKTALGDFSFNSDIQDRRTFNTTETETLYSVLLDGKHSIVGTWEGELVRDNFAITVKKSRGENRGVVITTHKNLKDYQRTRNSQNVVTRIHAKSTFKPEGAEKETTIRVTVDSPLINSYPYINEKEYENNNAKTVEELQKWAQSKFSNEGIDKVSDAIKIEAYELDGQVVHMGDTVNLKSWKHNVDLFKKAVAYEFDALKEEYISLTFDDKAGTGGSRASGGLASAADAILGVTESAQEIALEKALQNADLGFDHQAGLLRQEILDGIELARAKAEEVKRELSDTINQRFDSFDNASIQEARRKAEEALRSAGANALLAQEAKKISDQAKSEIDNLKTSSQTAIEQIEAFKTQYGTKLNEFKNTSDGILTKLGAIETYVNKDGQRQEELKRYARTESASQASAIREQISRDYVGKSAYQEDVRGLERRFSAISTQTDNDIATKIAQYKQTVDGQFASITSQMAGKANQTDFQQVRETSQLYERIIGRNENDIADKVSRMALTNQLFQIEVAKNVGYSRNYVKNADFREGNKNWNESVKTGLHFNYNHSSSNRGKPGVHIYGDIDSLYSGLKQKTKFEVLEGDIFTVSFLISKDGSSTYSGLDLGVHFRKNNEIISQKWISIPNSDIPNSRYKKMSFSFTSPKDIDELNLMLYGEQGKTINLYISEVKLEKGSFASDFTLSPEDTEEAIRTVQSQLAGSWSVQNINSAGDIISGINLGSNGQNRITGKATHITGETLIDNAVIKSAMIDKLKTANFEAGSVTTAILDAEAVTAEKVRMDQAFAEKLVASNIFTDTLAAKEAFINKLQSVVVTATLLEGYKGKIGGFQIGTHEKDSSVYWITGQNQFSVGMSNGSGKWNQTALWVNWGNNWERPSDYAWFVKHTGQMFCYNRAEFWNTPVIHGDLQVTGSIYYNNKASGGRAGHWVYSENYSNIEPVNGYLYLYYSGSGKNWIPMDKEISDRRYKTNIADSAVSGLDIINNLKTYSYRKEYDGKTTDISCGIMAQDVQKYIPEAFYENPDGAYSYRTFELVPYLIKAIQELNQKIEKLEEIA